MSRITRYFCDECFKEIQRVEVQWSGCRENGYRLLDFCGHAYPVDTQRTRS